jgi:uncharacterized alpha-E superfamily protein
VVRKLNDPDKRLALILSDDRCVAGVGPNVNSFYRASMAAREEWSITSIFAIESARARWFGGTPDVYESPFPYERELQNLALNLAAFHGLNLDSMTRDEAWALLDAGCRIERMSILAGLLSYLLEVDEPEPMGNLLNESVLFVSDSLGTYQSKFHSVPTTGLSLKLLLGEEDYPRSMHYLLARVANVFEKLTAPSRSAHPRERVIPMQAELAGFLELLGDGDAFDPAKRKAALAFLASIRERINELHDYLTTTYFSHAGYHG